MYRTLDEEIDLPRSCQLHFASQNPRPTVTSAENPYAYSTQSLVQRHWQERKFMVAFA